MADTNTTTIDNRIPDNVVRELLLAAWGEQTCRIDPDDWPRVLELLLQDRGASDPNRGCGRASLKPLVNTAVAELAQLFGADVLPPDPARAVWVAFPRLSRDNCAKLAALLIAARPDVRDAA